MVDLQRCTLSLYEIKDEEDIKYKLELRVFFLKMFILIVVFLFKSDLRSSCKKDWMNCKD